MVRVGESTGQDELQRWITRGQRKRRPGQDPVQASGLRFAFYGRTSTAGFQDRESSQGWQREAAEAVIAGRGAIVAEFFDAGCSWQSGWKQHPQVTALLAGGDRRFDAVVVGEYERVFAGEQLEEVATQSTRYGVQL